MTEIITQLIYPSPVLIFGFMIMILMDLITGIRKAARAGVATTSRGLRNTIDKAGSYLVLILSVLVLINITNLADTDKSFLATFSFSINGLIIGCIYIEVKSILENLITINTKEDKSQTDLCIYFLVPIHAIIILNLNKFKKQNTNDNISTD